MKNETIYRLRDEINHKNNLINSKDFSLVDSVESLHKGKCLEHNHEENEELENLRSQNEILKR